MSKELKIIDVTEFKQSFVSHGVLDFYITKRVQRVHLFFWIWLTHFLIRIRILLFSGA